VDRSALTCSCRHGQPAGQLGALSDSPVTAGCRYALYGGCVPRWDPGRRRPLVCAVLVRHAPVCYPLVIALITIVLGAVTSHILGKPDPAWVRAAA
jgi:hypothetical protein